MKKDWAYGIGSEELKQKGYIFNNLDYKTFIENFDADILLHSQDESGGNLQIWYEPLETFVTFYAP